MRFCVVLLLIFSASYAHARGPGWSLSMPTFQDDGDARTPFKVTVGTTTPVQLFSTDSLKDRAALVYNPSSQYVLLLGTSSNFNQTDYYWFVPKDSGTYVTSNHQALWAMYPPGGSSETVRGLLEKQ